jgi:hypothetical protein
MESAEVAAQVQAVRVQLERLEKLVLVVHQDLREATVRLEALALRDQQER